MNAARLKWIAWMAAFVITIQVVSGYRARTVREYATSAQVYWHLPQQANYGLAGGPYADQAVAIVTTAAELRNEGLVATAARKVRELAKLAPPKPDLRVGAAHVYTFRNGVWQFQQLDPSRSPEAFALWPYDGKLYTWDDFHAVSQWQNGALIAATPSRAIELQRAFPLDPDNYLPAGDAHPYDVVQDPITRDEWHAYRNLAAQPDGKPLTFPVGGKMLEVVARRDRSNGELSLSIRDGGELLPLWQAQPAARPITRLELMRYLGARPLSVLSAHERLRRFWIDLGGYLLAIFLVWAVFLRPLLLTGAPPSMQFVDANENEFPKLDRVRWNDYSTRLDALGFVRVRDFKLANTLHGGISRLFLHPETNCYASVFQVFAPTAPGLLFGYMSYLGEDWTVGHGTLKPVPSGVINRLRHRLAFSRPGCSLEALYHEHVAKRDEIAAGLGLAVVAPQGFETYQQRSDLESVARRDVIKRNPVLLAAKVYWAKLQPLSNDWWGDYPKEFQARTGQKFVPSEA